MARQLGERRMTLDRRLFLAGTGAALLPVLPAKAAPDTRFTFGAASMIQTFREDASYREALIRHCDIIVPMNDLKWEQLRHERSGFDFKDADEQVAFAQQHAKRLRGHTLVWKDALPAWMKAIETRAEAERELVNHIETVLDRYRSAIPSWDVVNEVIAHDPLEQGPLRNSSWLQQIGPSYIDLAFRTAGKAAPSAELVLNDYDLENTGPRFDARRDLVLAMARRFRDEGIPISAVGFQGHLYAEREIDMDGVARFVRDLKALDIHVLVTELDIIDWRLPADTALRDAAAAQHATRFFEAVNAEGTLKDVVSWGITDRYSWIAEVFPREDGLPPRPLPLDEAYQPKPLLAAIDALRKPA
jgi:endo-1,4-beta-xylanase